MDIGDGWAIVLVGIGIGGGGVIAACTLWVNGIDRRARRKERPRPRTTGTRNQRRAAAR